MSCNWYLHLGPGAFILTSLFLPVVLSRGCILACSLISLLLGPLINTCLCFSLVKPQRLTTGLKDRNNNCVVKGLGKRSLSFFASGSGFPRAFSMILGKVRDSWRHAGVIGSRRLCDRRARLFCGEQSSLPGLGLPDSRVWAPLQHSAQRNETTEPAFECASSWLLQLWDV